MSELIHRKERIIYTAIEVMNELGVQALSTKRIAKYQKMSESTIFKHFDNKVELMDAVLQFYAQYDNDLIETIESGDMKGQTGIRFFIGALMTYYGGYPAITAITQGLDEMRYIPELEHRVESIIRMRHGIIRRLVVEAKQSGEVSHDIDEGILTNIIIGSNQNLIREWRMKSFAFDLKNESDRLMDTIFSRFADKHERGEIRG